MVPGQGDLFSGAGQGLNDVPIARDSEPQAVSPCCLNPMQGVAADGTEAEAEGSGGEVGDIDGGDIDPGGEERAPGIKFVPEVYQPTKEELEEHNATHAQYRAWCPHCVRGRVRPTTIGWGIKYIEACQKYASITSSLHNT